MFLGSSLPDLCLLSSTTAIAYPKQIPPQKIPKQHERLTYDLCVPCQVMVMAAMEVTVEGSRTRL